VSKYSSQGCRLCKQVNKLNERDIKNIDRLEITDTSTILLRWLVLFFTSPYNFYEFIKVRERDQNRKKVLYR